MGLLSFLAVASSIAYGVISENKTSSYKTNKEEFLKSINYNVNVNRDFIDICNVCGVHKKKTNTLFGLQCNNNPAIWPKDGWKQCIPFLIEQPQLTDEDISLFIEIYNQERELTLQEFQQEQNKIYMQVKNAFEKDNIPNELITFEKNHWAGLSIDVHQKMANDIYQNTFWNRIATGPAKVFNDGNKRREIWQVRNYGKVPLNTRYNTCMRKCGYDKNML